MEFITLNNVPVKGPEGVSVSATYQVGTGVQMVARDLVPPSTLAVNIYPNDFTLNNEQLLGELALLAKAEGFIGQKKSNQLTQLLLNASDD